MARAARDAAGLCTKAAWHAAVAASRVRMPTDRRHVKWGDLVLRGDRSGKEDVDKEKNERDKGYGFWSRD